MKTYSIISKLISNNIRNVFGLTPFPKNNIININIKKVSLNICIYNDIIVITDVSETYKKGEICSFQINDYDLLFKLAFDVIESVKTLIK